MGKVKILGIWAKVSLIKDSVAAMGPGRIRQPKTSVTDPGPEPSKIWASELFDEGTCLKCAEIIR
jgi:hypothetical protein